MKDRKAFAEELSDLIDKLEEWRNHPDNKLEHDVLGRFDEGVKYLCVVRLAIKGG